MQTATYLQSCVRKWRDLALCTYDCPCILGAGQACVNATIISQVAGSPISILRPLGIPDSIRCIVSTYTHNAGHFGSSSGNSFLEDLSLLLATLTQCGKIAFVFLASCSLDAS